MMDQNNQAGLQETLVRSLLSEHKSSRRWKNARFIIWLLVFFLFYFSLMGPLFKDQNAPPFRKPYVSLIRLGGTIMPGNEFSARKILQPLQKAFSDKHSKGVVLLVNSPGGSPVQAAIIHDKIVQLKKKYHKKVIVVAEDMLASGAYLVATAADKIYVNADTLTGSIGVIMAGFGFKDAIGKIGVSRRVFTAGKNKDRLDAFRALNPADIEKVHKVLANVHANFIDYVMQGRKGKLHGDKKELFSGDFWEGQTAVKLGLADGVANIWTAMDQDFGTTYYQDYSPRPSFWETVAHDMSMQLHLALTESHQQLQATL